MKLGAKYWCGSLVVIGLVIALLGSTLVFAGNGNPGVLPINGRIGGLTYGQWSAKWWQYAFSLKTFDNCPAEPSGPIWFLVGTTPPATTATRHCTVPAGKHIMFPIFNTEQSIAEAQSSHTGNLPGSTCSLRGVNGKLIKGTSYASLLACAQAFTQHVLTQPGASLKVEIDGKKLVHLTQFRAATPPPPFSFTAVEGNPFNLCSTSHPSSSTLQRACPVNSRAAADGYWIILQKPLSPGSHTIHFSATVPFPELGFTFKTNVTYHLQVQ